MRRVIAIAVLALLGGCAGGAVDIQNAKARVLGFAAADVQGADALAQAQGDAIAHACYPVLLDWLNQQAVAPPATPTAGAAVRFQQLRGGVKRLSAGVPQAVLLGCAPLLVDATMDLDAFISKLSAMLAGAGVGLPVLP